MEKHHYKLLILIFVLIAAAAIFFVKLSAKPQKTDSSQPMPVAVAEAPELSSQGSPDGKSILTMKKEKTASGTAYTFLVTDDKGIQSVIYTKVASAGATLSIPANTFSPNNKYVFLKEDYSGQVDYFVPTASGILDISGPFEAKYPDLTITDVTGWGGMTLIVINTDKADGSLGPSFWYDVPSKSFIQLSTRFN